MTIKRFQGMKTTGLTLIELVIVCAIIAVLVGIVWVVMAPAREKARQAVCISNLTQIGHAFRMYRDDWDGVEPQKGVQLEYWELGLPPDKGTPIKSLQPYLKNREVWVCPDEFDPDLLRISSYAPNYCTHLDVTLYGSELPYDICFLSPIGYISFKAVISLLPEWPILICNRHHFFLNPKGDWLDMFWITLNLPDFSVHKTWSNAVILSFFGEQNKKLIKEE